MSPISTRLGRSVPMAGPAAPDPRPVVGRSGDGWPTCRWYSYLGSVFSWSTA